MSPKQSKMMMNMKSLTKVLSNKVVMYMITRYATYGVQFVVSLIIAAKLGPYYMGIWGVILLVVQYYRLVNFGIPVSSMVLNVQYKENDQIRKDYETNSLLLVGILCLIPLMAGIIYYLTDFSLIKKYELDDFFIYVCIMGMMAYFIDLYSKLFTVKGELFEVAFSQSIIPILTLLVVFLAVEKTLCFYLVGVNIIGYGLCLLLFFLKRKVSTKGHINKTISLAIIKKGNFLFIYNTSFYFILLFTKSFISINYTVEEFGYFSFAFTLSNAILLLLEAFSSLITPKLIDKMNTTNRKVILETIHNIRINYVYLSHGLMYIAIPLFPILLYFLPRYQPALVAINLIALTLVVSTNSYGYISLLMARNKERKLAFLSFSALVINFTLLYFFVFLLKVSFQYVIFATMISYVVYAYMCISIGHKVIGSDNHFFSVLSECFPVNLFVPFAVSICAALYGEYIFYWISPVLFFILNKKITLEIYTSFLRVLKNPDIADVK